MDETGQDEGRPESANSENGSENGFVEVTQEDARMASRSLEEPSSHVPALDDDEDLYGGAGSGDEGLHESGEGDGAGEAEVGLEEEKVRKPDHTHGLLESTQPSWDLALCSESDVSLLHCHLSYYGCWCFISVCMLLIACLPSLQPLSPPPSPVSPVPSGQLIDFEFGDDPSVAPQMAPSEGTIGQGFLHHDTPLIATAPEPLVPLDQPITISYEPSSFPVKTSPSPPPEREPTPPPPPPPKREPTPPLAPEREATPPPPPPPKREPTPPPPLEKKVSFADTSSVEEVLPTTSSAAHKGRYFYTHHDSSHSIVMCDIFSTTPKASWIPQVSSITPPSGYVY